MSVRERERYVCDGEGDGRMGVGGGVGGSVCDRERGESE